MPKQARSERRTQNCVAALFTDASYVGYLGYRHLVEWNQHDNTGLLKRKFCGKILGSEATRILVIWATVWVDVSTAWRNRSNDPTTELHVAKLLAVKRTVVAVSKWPRVAEQLF